MLAARAGAVCASIAISRSWISPSRSGSTSAVLALLHQRRALGIGGQHRLERRRLPRRALPARYSRAARPAASSASPSSGSSSPAITFTSVDLPAPLRPISPTRLARRQRGGGAVDDRAPAEADGDGVEGKHGARRLAYLARRIYACDCLSLGAHMIRTLLAALLVSTAALPALAQEAKPAFAEPSLSPDGATIAFSSGGDIWEVPAAGGVARLAGYRCGDRRPPALFARRHSPGVQLDPRRQQQRLGARPCQRHSHPPDLGRGERGTRAPGRPTANTCISRPARATSAASPTSGASPPPAARRRRSAASAICPNITARLRPTASQLALLARGISNGQWWRNGTSHIDENELWVRPIATDGAYRQLLADGAKHAWPMWSADGANLWFMSAKSGTENLWTHAGRGRRSAAGRRSFTDGRVLYPQIGRDGRSIVFERDFGIWRMDTATGQASPVPITLRGAAAAEGKRHLTLSTYERMAVSPDGQKLAVIGHGELFAVNAKDGGQAQRITDTLGVGARARLVARIRAASSTPPSAGTERWLAEYDVAASRETLLTRAGFATVPVYAPDGKSAVYVQGKDQLSVVTLPRAGQAVARTHAVHRRAGDRRQRRLDPGLVARRQAGSPSPSPTASRSPTSTSSPPAGGAARPISFLANGQLGRIAWSPDGKYILFDTSQRSEDSRIVRVDLVPHVPQIPRGRVPRPVQARRRPGQARDPRAGTAPTPDTSQAAPPSRCPRATSAAGAAARQATGEHRLGRPARAGLDPAARPRRRIAGDLAGRQDAGVRRGRTRPDQPVELRPRRTGRRQAGAAGDYRDRRATRATSP